MVRRAQATLLGIALVAVASQIVAFSAAAFSTTKQNPANSFQAAASFCVAPGTQTLAASRDSYVESGLLAGSNYGNATSLRVRPAPSLAGAFRTLIGFQLPPVPSNCMITAVALRLYVTASDANDRTLQVYRLNGSWTETGVTWNNQPATTGAAATSTSLGQAGWQSWSVLSHVQAMYSGQNDGFLIRDAVDSTLAAWASTYQSRNGTPDTQDPQLLVTFG